MGAIGDPEYLPVLTEHCTHPLPEIAETCQIAVDLIKWKENEKEKNAKDNAREGTSGVYLSVDPAPPFEPSSEGETVFTKTENPEPDVSSMRCILLNKEKSLFDRYRAMFSLRNMNNDSSALAICDSFCDNSALFRHEVAYVLGQMQRRVTIPSLKIVLENESEHKMVRHEAAEALGAIGGPDVDVILQQYKNDTEDVVRESAEVALDAMDYWTNFS